ncbi:MAG: uracil-DNA glycosylase [Clostridia bacterium]|nr:uracil-DNA glycosylase [Clostridia bacterium]
MVNFENDWDKVLAREFDKPYYLNLREFLKKEYKSRRIFPDMYHIFNALKYSSYQDTRVVILGQDPYHEVGQAHGLCFSVQKGVKKPPSLVNIFKELESDLGIKEPEDGDLSYWAKQGVLLLNTCLTVREGQANSHRGKGWETFTDQVICKLNEKDSPVVFILWGNNARSKKELITNPKHLVIESVHPSPLSASRGFFGGKYFSRTNEFLEKQGLEKIDWEIK